MSGVGRDVKVQVESFFDQYCFNVVRFVYGDCHIHEINCFCSFTELPCLSGECIHFVLEMIPFQCVLFVILMWAPYSDDVVDESSIEDHSLGMVWKEFFFMNSVIYGGVGWRWGGGGGGAHSSPVELF